MRVECCDDGVELGVDELSSEAIERWSDQRIEEQSTEQSGKQKPGLGVAVGRPCEGSWSSCDLRRRRARGSPGSQGRTHGPNRGFGLCVRPHETLAALAAVVAVVAAALAVAVAAALEAAAVARKRPVAGRHAGRAGGRRPELEAMGERSQMWWQVRWWAQLGWAQLGWARRRARRRRRCPLRSRWWVRPCARSLVRWPARP